MSMDCLQTAMEFIDFAMAVRSYGVESKTNTPAFERFRKNTITPIFTPAFKNETKDFTEKGESWVENWMMAIFPMLMDSPDYVSEPFKLPYRAAVEEIQDGPGESNLMYDSEALSRLLLSLSVDALFECEKRARKAK